MIQYIVVAFLLLVARGMADTNPASAQADTAELPSNVIARIDGKEIPGAWFLHEFRSTFFRYSPSGDVRRAVFEPFLKRMILAAKARELGLDKGEELNRDIDQRLSDMKAFMDYQLEMTRISMLNEALLKEMKLSVTTEDVSDEDLRLFFEARIQGRPGAPSSLEELPEALRERIRSQAAQAKLEARLDETIETWRESMTIEVNTDAVESVPFPEMKGDVPPDLH